MTMTTTETFVEATRRSQEAFMQLWTDGVRRYFGLLPTPDAKVPSAEEVVDNVFDFAEAVLATQREYAKSMLATTKSVAKEASWMAQDVAKNTTSKDS
jgi:hypothetical protein